MPTTTGSFSGSPSSPPAPPEVAIGLASWWRGVSDEGLFFQTTEGDAMASLTLRQIAPNSTSKFRIEVVASNDDQTSFMSKAITVTAGRAGDGDPAVLLTVDRERDDSGAGAATWAVDVFLATGGEDLGINVTGEAGVSIGWLISVRRLFLGP